MSRESAGATIRELREARDWSLADFASVTGVSIMGLSYLERGARKPHKGTVQKVENGLGLPPGTYSRLVVAADPAAELERLTARYAAGTGAARTTGPIVVDRHTDTEMLEGYAEAHLDAINSVIDRLPASTSNEYETYILSVIGQCVKAEMLAANSWRVAVNADAASAGRLMRASAGVGRNAGSAHRAHADEPQCAFRPGLRRVVAARAGDRRTDRRHRRRNVGHPQ